MPVILGIVMLASVASAQSVARFRRSFAPSLSPACRAATSAAASGLASVYVLPCAVQTGDELRRALRDAAAGQGSDGSPDASFTVGAVERCAIDRLGGQAYLVTMNDGTTAVQKYVIVRKNLNCGQALASAPDDGAYHAKIPAGIPGLSQ